MPTAWFGMSLQGRTGVRASAFWLLLVSLAPLQGAGLQPGERLDYTFSYQGVFSGFVQIGIARATFGVAAQPTRIDGRQTYLTRLDLSTEAYRKAELIYPIRYRFLSWLEPARQTPLLAQEYLRTNEISEELLWFDLAQRTGYRYLRTDTAQDGAERLPAQLWPLLDSDPAEWSPAPEEHRQALGADSVWDYLSMLYRLRFADLQPNAQFDLPLYNGKRIKIYRVEVGQERLQHAGWDLPAFRLGLYEVRHGRRKGDSVTTIWISDDAKRRPLRFHVERGFGIIEGLLETGRPSLPAARSSPRPPAAPSG